MLIQLTEETYQKKRPTTGAAIPPTNNADPLFVPTITHKFPSPNSSVGGMIPKTAVNVMPGVENKYEFWGILESNSTEVCFTITPCVINTSYEVKVFNKIFPQSDNGTIEEFSLVKHETVSPQKTKNSNNQYNFNELDPICTALNAGPYDFHVFIRVAGPLDEIFTIYHTQGRDDDLLISRTRTAPTYVPHLAKITYNDTRSSSLPSTFASNLYCAVFSPSIESNSAANLISTTNFDRCAVKNYLEQRFASAHYDAATDTEDTKSFNFTLSVQTLQFLNTSEPPPYKLGDDRKTDYIASCSAKLEQNLLYLKNEQLYQMGLFSVHILQQMFPFDPQLKIEEYPFTEIVAVVPSQTEYDVTTDLAFDEIWNFDLYESSVTIKVHFPYSNPIGNYLILTQPYMNEYLPVQVHIWSSEVNKTSIHNFTLHKYKYLILDKIFEGKSLYESNDTVITLTMHHKVCKKATKVAISQAEASSKLKLPVLHSNELSSEKIWEIEVSPRDFLNDHSVPFKEHDIKWRLIKNAAKHQLEYRVVIWSIYKSTSDSGKEKSGHLETNFTLTKQSRNEIHTTGHIEMPHSTIEVTLQKFLRRDEVVLTVRQQPQFGEPVEVNYYKIWIGLRTKGSNETLIYLNEAHFQTEVKRTKT